MMGACCCASLRGACAALLVVVGLGGWRPVPAWRGAASFRDVSANDCPIVVRTNEQRYPGAQRCTMKPSRCVCDACRRHKKADTQLSSASASVLQYASASWSSKLQAAALRGARLLSAPLGIAVVHREILLQNCGSPSSLQTGCTPAAHWAAHWAAHCASRFSCARRSICRKGTCAISARIAATYRA